MAGLLMVFALLGQWAWADGQRGQAWLNSQIHASGQLANETRSRAYPLQSRSEVMQTLGAAGDASQTALLNAVVSEAARTVEDLARQALAQQSQGLDDSALLDALLDMQNTDGGFGVAAGFASSSTDTSWALKALAHSRSTATSTRQALTWLMGVRQQAGAWQDMPDGDEVMPTAQAIQALQLYRSQSAVPDVLTQARRWLVAQSSTAHTWGDAARSASSLLALLPGSVDAASLQPALGALAAEQLGDGSWGGDPYTTALAVRALHLAAQPYTDPDLAGLTGQLLDEGTGLPIAQASLRLAVAQRTWHSDAQGSFSAKALKAGADTLSIEASAYRRMQVPLNLQPGQQLDLGQIRMSPLASGVSTVRLSGTVSSKNASGRVAPLSRAWVRVGAAEVQSGSDGSYALDVPAGSMTVQVVHASYPTVTATLQAQAGDALVFNAVMEARATASTKLTVVVTDQATGAPLSQVQVSLILAKSSMLTDANGIATFNSGLMQGDNHLRVELVGYQTALIHVTNPNVSHIQLPVTLGKLPTGSPNTTVLEGVVVDAASRQPLAGVAVAVLGTTRATVTDADGVYRFTGTGLTGSKVLSLSLSGYELVSVPFEVTGNRMNVLNVAMLMQGQGTGLAELRVQATDRSTGAPVAQAQLVLSGANTQTVLTEADGTATVLGLSSGNTQLVLSASGYEGVVAQVNVQAGQRYSLPVDLVPVDAAQGAQLHGQVVDAVTQAPLADVQVLVTGAWTGSASTGPNGAYALPVAVDGQVHIQVKKTGYVDLVQTLTLRGGAEASMALTPSWQQESPWVVSGQVLDAQTLEPLLGAELMLEEVDPGVSVIRSDLLHSGESGLFEHPGLTAYHARLLVRMAGYDSVLLPLTKPLSGARSVMVSMHKSYDPALPDLQVSDGSRAGLVVDPNTFKASGVLTVAVKNNSGYDAGAFQVSAFLDTNGNQLWDAGVDVVLDSTELNGLAANAVQQLSFAVQNVALPFRDAPVFVTLDSGQTVVESIEGNNTLRIRSVCTGDGGTSGFQDVAVCIDASGSVSSTVYQMEMDGVIQALSNPNIIPHDGSVRFTLNTAGNNQPQLPLHPAVVVSSETLPSLLESLRTKEPVGSASSGGACVANLATYLGTLKETASRITAIAVGDGAWETVASIERTHLPKAVSLGVTKVDAIGVGNVNLPILEAVTWPKPANTPLGGQAVVAYSTGEVAAAMAASMGRAAQAVDLTLGNFRMMDLGSDRVALQVRVGNAGSAALASTVRFYQGDVLLGEVPVPALKTGQWRDVSLPDMALVGSASLVAVVDEARVNAECSTGNNRQQIDLMPANALAALTVGTDQSVYATASPVVLQANVRNQGSFPAALSLVLSVEDSAGQEVHMFPEQALGTLAPADEQPVRLDWHTDRYQAGSYVLRGRVFDAAGQVVVQAQSLFAIGAGNGSEPVAALMVSTDKGSYTSNDTVHIGQVLSNLVSNTLLDDVLLRLTVRDPHGAEVFSAESPIGQLPSLGVITRPVQQSLQGAALGTHQVQAVLMGGLRKSTPLASATVSYQVVAANAPVGIAGLVGELQTNRRVMAADDALTRSDAVHNTGTEPLNDLQVARVLVNAATGDELAREEVVLSLSAGEQIVWLNVPVATQSLRDGDYALLLMARQTGEFSVLAQQVFTLRDGANDGGNLPKPPTALQPVPANAAFAVLALALLMIAGGAGFMRRQTKKLPQERAHG